MDQLASCTQQKAGGSERISALNRWKMRPHTQGFPLTSLERPQRACIHTMHHIYKHTIKCWQKNRRKPESSCIENRNIKWYNL